MSLIMIVTFALLIGLLASGAWIGLALMGVGLASLSIFRSVPVEKLLAQNIWNGLTSPELVALPLFILMAELLYRSKFIGRLFNALEPWVRYLPGGLLHTNILGCTFFALISGSSAATTSAVGRITIKELERRGYRRSSVIGSLGGAGTLGFLIPPSLIMIIYGVLSQTSILKLFTAGILPGFLLASSFMTFVGVKESLGGAKRESCNVEKATLWRERFSAIPALMPFFILIGVLLGSMYGGLASPSEAAALAIGITLIIMVHEKSLNIAVVQEACLGTARTVSMLGLIIGAAVFLSTAMGFLGLPAATARAVNAMNLNPFMLVMCLVAIYIFLGCFLEGTSLIVMTLPIVVPLITQAGYDKVWFGVFLIIVVEMAQITPPVGMNLFVIQGLTGESLINITRSVLPFFVIMILFSMFLAIFPGVVTVLSNFIN